jgi:hypothetical protein
MINCREYGNEELNAALYEVKCHTGRVLHFPMYATLK